MLNAGDRIDEWVVDGPLGAGGTASVYRCHNASADRIVAALKVLDTGALVRADARARLAREGVPLTVCPLSNVRLRVFDRLEDHNLRELLAAGLHATVNSDDPAYFGGYVGENFLQTSRALGLTAAEIRLLAENSFTASFLPADAQNVSPAGLAP